MVSSQPAVSVLGRETHSAQNLQSNLFRSRDRTAKSSVVAGILY